MDKIKNKNGNVNFKVILIYFNTTLDRVTWFLKLFNRIFYVRTIIKHTHNQNVLHIK